MSLPFQLDPLTMSTAFLLGLRHALEPGHGKAVIATYMGQADATYGDLLKLGGIVSVAHSVVLLLSILLFFQVFHNLTQVPPLWLDILQALSATVIVLLGTGMLLRSRQVLEGEPVASTCATACQHEPVDRRYLSATSPKFKELFLLGLVSGIRPCPLTLSGLIMAVSLGQREALSFILVFSFGMAIVLMGVGLLGKLAGTSLEEASARYAWLSEVQRWLPFVSALLILGMGLLFLGMSLAKFF